MKLSINDFFSKCDQIRRKLRIWSHLLKNSLMENFIVCTVSVTFETGLSDHDKLITTILRKTISKGSSKKMCYRDYKRFDQKKFEIELKIKF